MTCQNEFSQLLAGFVAVPVSLLDFDARGHHPRQVDRRIQSRLRDVFAVNCEPAVSANHVDGVLTEKELHVVLSELGVSAAELKQTLCNGTYPRLERTRIWCPSGRHRIQTAIDLFGTESSWVVQLYCIPDSFTDDARSKVVRALSERYHPQFSHSDGEVFCSVRRHRASERQVQSWSVRLTPCKRISLRMLLGEKSRMKMYSQIGGATAQATVLEAFDRLTVFPGLWEGLQLGNIHKHLALRCNDQIVSYLSHIYHVWHRIAGDDQCMRNSVDIETVRRLQSLAPEASAADRAIICELMDTRQIFVEVHDSAIRERIKQRLLGLRTVIPTIRSFHENMKLFTILVKILRQYLIPHKPKSQLIGGLAEDWHSPPAPVVEVSEGVFHTTTSPLSFSLAWQHMALAALRNFPDLCNESPKQDRKDYMRANIQPSSVSAFYRSAKLLGFSNRIVDDHLGSPLHSQDKSVAAVASDNRTDVEIKAAQKRFGRPHARTFRQIRKIAFFPQLQAAAPVGPTVAYIYTDILNAFIRLADFESSREPRVISIWGGSQVGHDAQDPTAAWPGPVQLSDIHRGTQTDGVVQCRVERGTHDSEAPGQAEVVVAQDVPSPHGIGHSSKELEDVVSSPRPSFDTNRSPVESQHGLSPVSFSIGGRSLLQTPTSRAVSARRSTRDFLPFGRSLTGGSALSDSASRDNVLHRQSDASRSLLHTPARSVREVPSLSRTLLDTPNRSLLVDHAANRAALPNDILFTPYQLLGSGPSLIRDSSRSLLHTPDHTSFVAPSSQGSLFRGSVSEYLTLSRAVSSSQTHADAIRHGSEDDDLIDVALTPPLLPSELGLTPFDGGSPTIRSESERTILETPQISEHDGFFDSESEYLV